MSRIVHENPRVERLGLVVAALAREEASIGVGDARAHAHHGERLTIGRIGVLIASGVVEDQRLVHQAQAVDAALGHQAVEHRERAVGLAGACDGPGADDIVGEQRECALARRDRRPSRPQVVLLHEGADLADQARRAVVRIRRDHAVGERDRALDVAQLRRIHEGAHEKVGVARIFLQRLGIVGLPHLSHRRRRPRTWPRDSCRRRCCPAAASLAPLPSRSSPASCCTPPE